VAFLARWDLKRHFIEAIANGQHLVLAGGYRCIVCVGVRLVSLHGACACSGRRDETSAPDIAPRARVGVQPA
jgi:hypothetical protein